MVFFHIVMGTWRDNVEIVVIASDEKTAPPLLNDTTSKGNSYIVPLDFEYD